MKKIIIPFLTLTFLGCAKDKVCLSYEQAFVGHVDGNSIGQINQEINFQVSFGCHNGCGQFGHFEEIVSGNTRTIIVNAKYEGCACTQDAPSRTATYKFKTSQAGTYLLKFQQANNTFLTDTLTVQ